LNDTVDLAENQIIQSGSTVARLITDNRSLTLVPRMVAGVKAAVAAAPVAGAG
jgi:hypothetical protein